MKVFRLLIIISIFVVGFVEANAQVNDKIINILAGPCCKNNEVPPEQNVKLNTPVEPVTNLKLDILNPDTKPRVPISFPSALEGPCCKNIEPKPGAVDTKFNQKVNFSYLDIKVNLFAPTLRENRLRVKDISFDS